MYGLESGAAAYFDSTRNAGGQPATRFGLTIFGAQGVIQSFDTGTCRRCTSCPIRPGPRAARKQWTPISSAGVGRPEPLENRGLPGGNVLAVKDLIRAVEKDGLPLANIYDARIATEMVVAVFESHRQGKPVPLPLANRRNPLAM